MPAEAHHDTENSIVGRIGPIELDWPRSVGFYGGIAAGVALEVIPFPVGIFIAAIPFIKMLSNPGLPMPLNVVGQVFAGAAKPVGGDSEGTIKLVTPPAGVRRAARTVADGRSPNRPSRRSRSAARPARPAAPAGRSRPLRTPSV